GATSHFAGCPKNATWQKTQPHRLGLGAVLSCAPACRQQGEWPSWSILTKGTRTTRASGFVLRTICAHVPALQAPLSTLRGWHKMKGATRTDGAGYWKWHASIVPSPRSSPSCRMGIRTTKTVG